MKDNELLVEFNSIVDTDYGVYNYIRNNFSDSEYATDIVKEENPVKVISKLISRHDKNPLSVIFNQEVDPTKLYQDIMSMKYEQVLNRVPVYNTFNLMNSFLNNASSVGITILCMNPLEEEFIQKNNPRLRTLLVNDKKEINLREYTVLYVKYLDDLFGYNTVEGKNIYAHMAGYNYGTDNELLDSAVAFSINNRVSLVDLYIHIKYKPLRRS